MRRRCLAAAAAIAAVGLAIGVAPGGASAPVATVRIDGTGFGHGVGLSQWGAESLARSGRSTYEILGTFYPGTQLSEATGPIRVAVHQPAAGATTLTFPQGGEVRSPAQGPQVAGFPVRVGPGGRVRLRHDGRLQVTPLVDAQATAATPYQEPCALVLLCPTTTAPPPTTTTAPPPAGPGGGGAPPPVAPVDDDGPAPAPAPTRAGATTSGSAFAVPAEGGVVTVDDRARSYRGAIEALADPGLRLVNLVGVEDYLRGMAEVPGTWPPAAVQAQTIAARTYALRAVQASGEICDDARCQVYEGTTAESPGQDAAVAATARQVIAYDGALAAAVYSADAGGVSATTFEGFGTPDGVYPYLTTVAYETDNPLPWTREVALTDLARRLGYRGTISGARVGDKGPSDRALTVVLEGSAGDQAVDGRTFARALGLRSTRFTLTLDAAPTAPALPDPGSEAIQALPEETGALARQPLTAEPATAPAPLEAAGTPTDVGPAGPGRRPEAAGAVGLLALAMAAGALTRAGSVDARPSGVRAWARWQDPTHSP